ncbi:flippase [Epilithonimonas caeni]|uniref:flippase n=1 Tax=Epilithonimonas caeni TaxID=365343 RepID=UPI0003FDBC30|nr:flippase [Epilithonimonas caeni]
MQAKEGKLVSLKLNFIFNILRVSSTALITLFTMPYLNRTLGAENIGKVEYIYTVINYFVLFSSLGIPMYGIRETSKVRHDSKKLYTLVFELLVILGVTTLISYLIIFGIIIQINNFNPYKNLICILSFMVLLNNIGAEWYFQGTENQKFITLRNLVIRLIIVILIFTIITSTMDYEKYSILLVIMFFGANIINFSILIYHILKNKINWKSLNLKRHYKPILTIFIATISVNIYVQLDKFLIGNISGDKDVAYYTLSNNLLRFVILFLTALGSVMLPRLSYLYVNDKEQYIEFLKKIFNVLLIISIPFSIFFLIFAENIIILMGGREFAPAILSLKILSPLCILFSIAYFFGFMVLYPQGEERIYSVATAATALLSIGLNIYAIKNYKIYGASVVALISESLLILFMCFLMKKVMPYSTIFNKNSTKIILINLIIFIVLSILVAIFTIGFIEWFIFMIVTVVIYLILLYIFGEETITELISILKTKF